MNPYCFAAQIWRDKIGREHKGGLKVNTFTTKDTAPKFCTLCVYFSQCPGGECIPILLTIKDPAIAGRVFNKYSSKNLLIINVNGPFSTTVVNIPDISLSGFGRN